MFCSYYIELVMGLVASSPGFQEIVENSCPTRWLDGSICSPADDLMNKAFMEVDILLMQLEADEYN